MNTNSFLFTSSILLILLVTSCGQSVAENLTTVEVTVIHTQISKVEVTVIVEKPVTVTFTPTPLNTPTITPTPTITQTFTITPTPTNTPDLAKTATIEAYGDLTKPKNNGFYTVGVDILPGKWESSGTGDGCYWARLDSNQELLGNHYGYAGGTVNIRATDYEVEFDDCGRWFYVEGMEKILQDDSMDDKPDGFYTVGVEISPGRWKSTGTGDSCYWARLNEYQDLLDNHYGNAGGTVTVRSSDYEVQFNDCGKWEYLGP